MLGLSGQLLDSALVSATTPTPAPVIAPAAAPEYQPPVSVPMVQDPVEAPAPVGQIRGSGGTSFQVSAGSIKLQPYVLPPVIRNDGDSGLYVPPPNDAYNPNAPAPLTPETMARPGDSTIQPVPRGIVPGKPAIAPAVPAVPVPKVAGPIKGNVLGFDLSLVPLWAWIVGAALVGARVLK